MSHSGALTFTTVEVIFFSAEIVLLQHNATVSFSLTGPLGVPRDLMSCQMSKRTTNTEQYANMLMHIHDAFPPDAHAYLFETHAYSDANEKFRKMQPKSGSVPFFGTMKIKKELSSGDLSEEQVCEHIKKGIERLHSNAGKRLFSYIRALSDSKVRTAFDSLTGHPPWLILDLSRISYKKQADANKVIAVYQAYHTDTYATSHNFMTAWVAECDAGVKNPGLCFYRFQDSDDYKSFLLNHEPRQKYTQEELEQRYPSGKPVVPKTAPTDVLLFGNKVVHKTQDDILAWTERRSYEFRLSHPSIWDSGRHSGSPLGILASASSNSRREVTYLIKPYDYVFRCSV